MTDTLTRAANPPPASRGLWTVGYAARARGALAWQMLGWLPNARSRRLTTHLNGPAQFTFTVDGRDSTAYDLRELEQEVFVFRWDDQTGQDVAYFRGVVCHTQDVISEQAHSLNVTCYDSLWLIDRRFVTHQLQMLDVDQDLMVLGLVARATTAATTSGNVSLSTGAALPLTVDQRDPAGVLRGLSGVNRTRIYLPQKSIGEAIAQLAEVINGFDFGLTYNPYGTDTLNVYYPYRGVTRPAPLRYGDNISGLSRSFNANDYANYFRVTGAEPATQWTESVSGAANSGTERAGLWMWSDSLSDVSESSTLAERVAAAAATMHTPAPSYSLNLRPGWYYHGAFGLGDTAIVQVNSGRLQNVESAVRVVGITHVIGDDGQEDVEVDVVRAPASLLDPIRNNTRGLAALQRR